MEVKTKKPVKFGAIDAVILGVIGFGLFFIAGILPAFIGVVLVLILVLSGVIKTHS